MGRRTTVSSRALRHYLEVAEMWDVGDLDPHMLDTAVIMALKMYMKGQLLLLTSVSRKVQNPNPCTTQLGVYETRGPQIETPK